MLKMKKEDMIDTIIEGHIDNIQEWVLKDIDSLSSWLEAVLELEDKTKEELIENYGSYLVSYEDLESDEEFYGYEDEEDLYKDEDTED